MGDIELLNQESADRIRAQQIIVGVESVVKELVENAIDACAKNIEIRFLDQGLERIDVIDDGKGIKRSDIENLAKRSHTSKLCAGSLEDVRTFGYRGEALFALSHLRFDFL